MRIGMLWFDNDPKVNLDAKVERATIYYTTKYGCPPNLCFVHPTMLPTIPEGTTLASGEVEIRPNKSILPNHFWIGVHDPKEQPHAQ